MMAKNRRLLSWTKKSNNLLCDCEFSLESLSERSLDQGFCEACEFFFYSAIQNYYRKGELGPELYQTKPLFKVIYGHFEVCRDICETLDFCNPHFYVIFDRFEKFFEGEAAPFQLNIQIKSAISTLYYCLYKEFLACNQKHKYCEQHRGLSGLYYLRGKVLKRTPRYPQ